MAFCENRTDRKCLWSMYVLHVYICNKIVIPIASFLVGDLSKIFTILQIVPIGPCTFGMIEMKYYLHI